MVALYSGSLYLISINALSDKADAASLNARCEPGTGANPDGYTVTMDYTIKDEDESNLVINGALQIRRFFLVKISRKSF